MATILIQAFSHSLITSYHIFDYYKSQKGLGHVKIRVSLTSATFSTTNSKTASPFQSPDSLWEFCIDNSSEPTISVEAHLNTSNSLSSKATIRDFPDQVGVAFIKETGLHGPRRLLSIRTRRSIYDMVRHYRFDLILRNCH